MKILSCFAVMLICLSLSLTPSYAETTAQVLNYHQDDYDNSQRRLEELEARLREDVQRVNARSTQDYNARLEVPDEPITPPIIVNVRPIVLTPIVEESVQQPIAQQESTPEPVKGASVQPKKASPAIPVPVKPAVQAKPMEPKRSVQRAKVATPALNVDREHGLELSIETFGQNYKQPDGDYKRNAVFGGIGGAYNYRPLAHRDWWINVLHVDLSLDYGKSTYTFEFEGEKDKLNRISNFSFEPRLWLGKDIDIDSQLRVTPYAGVAYRWYYEQLKNKSIFDTPTGYDKETEYFYVPVGADVSMRVSQDWRLVFNAEYDHIFSGRVSHFFQDIPTDAFFVGPISNGKNNLEGGQGFRMSLKLVKEGDRVNYFVQPFYRYWHVNESNEVDYTVNTIFGPFTGPLQEFENTTHEAGIKLGAEF